MSTTAAASLIWRIPASYAVLWVMALTEDNLSTLSLLMTPPGDMILEATIPNWATSIARQFAILITRVERDPMHILDTWTRGGYPRPGMGNPKYRSLVQASSCRAPMPLRNDSSELPRTARWSTLTPWEHMRANRSQSTVQFSWVTCSSRRVAFSSSVVMGEVR